MSMDDKKLRDELALVMAAAVDEAENMEIYLKSPGSDPDFGLAPADGSIPGNLAILIEYANACAQIVKAHGMPSLNTAGSLASIYSLYIANKSIYKVDYTASEDSHIKNAVEDHLKNKSDT